MPMTCTHAKPHTEKTRLTIQVRPQLNVIPYTEKGARSTLIQGTYLDFRFNPQSGCLPEAANTCFCLTLMFLALSLPLSIKSINISLGEDFLNNNNNPVQVWLKCCEASHWEWKRVGTFNHLNISIPKLGVLKTDYIFQKSYLLLCEFNFPTLIILPVAKSMFANQQFKFFRVASSFCIKYDLNH